MAEPEDQKPMNLGMFASRGDEGGLSRTELIAGAASVIWLLGVTLFFVMAAGDGTASVDSLRFVMSIIAIFMPVALIWVAAAAARSSRIMREESTRLQVAIDAMRQTYIQGQQSSVLGVKPELEQKLDAIIAGQSKTDAALANFGHPAAGSRIPAKSRIALAQPKAATSAQPSLALGTPAQELDPPLSTADFVRALHFPENATDKDGFRSLRLALQNHSVAQLVQAAQDVLTLLSQDGIYMDDLKPDRSRPELWRRFAKGERGKELAGIGAIRDRSSLALAAGRMRQDMIFRDSVHHFLRKFDHTFIEFEKTASDQDIIDLAETRSARAFMLLGRATGTFD